MFADQIDLSMTEIDADMTPAGSIIFYLSVASTFVAALNAYINPSCRWKQIRDTTCNLESAIWQYRTCTGQFKLKNPRDVDTSASILKKEVSFAVDALIGSSDIGQSTSWSKRYSDSVFKHGQKEHLQVQKSMSGSLILSKQKSSNGMLSWLRKTWSALLKQKDKVHPEQNHGVAGTYASPDFAEGPVDDHHSPLTPEKYIEFRLKNVVFFFKNRLPVYTSSRNLLSVTLMVVTAVGTILAYKQFSSYVSISATVAAAITSWMEFNNIASKIGRYNSTVSSLESLILWWSSLTDVEKAAAPKIEELVQKGEQVVF